MASAKGKGTAGSGRTRSTAKKPAAKKKTSASEARETRRFWSYILFFLGVAELLLTYVRGDGFWEKMFIVNRGIFGISVFLLGPLIIYVAMQIASDKKQSTIIARVIQGVVMMLLFSATAQILFGDPIVGTSFGKKIQFLYSGGTTLSGGGVAAALIGWPLLALFKKVGGAIVVLLLDFTFIMLLTNVTLPQLFKAVSKPFVGGYKAVGAERAERAAAHEEKMRLKAEQQAREQAETGKEKPRVDIAKYYRDEETEKEAKAKRTKKGTEVTPYTPKGEEPEPPKTDISKLIEEAVGMSSQPTEAEILDAEKEREENLKNNQDRPEITLPKFGRGRVWDLPEKNAKIPREEAEEAAGKTVYDKLFGDDEDTKSAAEQEPAGAVLTEPEQKPAAHRTLKKPEVKQKEVYVDPNGQTSMVKQEETIPVYTCPPVDILKYASNQTSQAEIQAEIKSKSLKLVQTLEDFGIKTNLVGISRGPSVTRYELEPGRGVSVSKIENRAKDIALNLATNGVRIAPIPGKAAIGVEVPNLNRDSVSLRELIDSDDYRNAKSKLSFAVGKDIDGNIVMGDIATMPHMLIAGTTGSGKSVFTNSIILNILYHATPEEVRLILIDPKKVEFPVYNGIPHLLIPVVTDPMKAAGALGWAVNEMMRRYNLFEANGVKNIEDYNEYVDENPELGYRKLHYVVIIIDEFADLMLAAKSEVEESVMRLAQLARAAGMHMLIATQSPRTDVITGLIKANIPSRTALSVSSNIDSRVILDEIGAEDLLGRGDLLYKPVGYPKPLRIQSGFASTNEIRNVVKFLKNELGNEYDEEIVHEVERNQRELEQAKNKNAVSADDVELNPDDDLTNQAITIIVETGNASTAFLQRKLKLGFPRAARIMDDIEAMGIIGPQEGSKPRKINITKEEWYERQGRS
ncbi:MAG: DNA translocase FtsK [Ruminococcus sp.]|nr:DNA translocase FtsK [Ruminococcus sp.]